MICRDDLLKKKLYCSFSISVFVLPDVSPGKGLHQTGNTRTRIPADSGSQRHVKDCLCFSFLIFPQVVAGGRRLFKRPLTISLHLPLPLQIFFLILFVKLQTFKFMLPGKCPAKCLPGIIRYRNKAQRWCMKASHSTPQYRVSLP